ncbi:hypothetical protein, partial [Pseudonocardia sp. ICBG1142]|uniref:hypothetical protein n=1 Tax=Pseudonocardia sp. ICBG1142 TaxID=2846760 RepID=UPI001CF6A4D8
MSTKKCARVIGTVLVVAVSMGSATGIAAAETSVAPPASAASSYSLATASGQEQDRIEGLTLFLERVNSVPTSVLYQGDSATQDWLRANYPNTGGQSRASVIGCVGAIGVAVGGVLVPAAKILKIKKLVCAAWRHQRGCPDFPGCELFLEKIQAIGGR